MGLFLMTSGLGSYLASAIVSIAKAATDGGYDIYLAMNHYYFSYLVTKN